MLQRLANLGNTNIFITHYAQLLQREELDDKVLSAHMAYVEEHGRPGELPDVHFLYKLRLGASGKSHGYESTFYIVSALGLSFTTHTGSTSPGLQAYLDL